MLAFINIQTVLCYTFIGLSIATLLTAFIFRLIKMRHLADILELFAAGFFLIYAVQNCITFGFNSVFNILLLSLSILLGAYKIIFFVRGK